MLAIRGEAQVNSGLKFGVGQNNKGIVVLGDVADVVTQNFHDELTGLREVLSGVGNADSAVALAAVGLILIGNMDDVALFEAGGEGKGSAAEGELVGGSGSGILVGILNGGVASQSVEIRDAVRAGSGRSLFQSYALLGDILSGQLFLKPHGSGQLVGGAGNSLVNAALSGRQSEVKQRVRA